MYKPSFNPWRASAMRNVREAGGAPFSSRLVVCRRCSHLSASTSYSDSHRLLLQLCQESRLHQERLLLANASLKSTVVSEDTTTDSLPEAPKGTGPVQHLGYVASMTAHAIGRSVVQKLLAMHRLPSDFQAHYKLEQEIGRGAWATVHLATELESGEKYMRMESPTTLTFTCWSRCSTLCGCMQTGCQGPRKMD